MNSLMVKTIKTITDKYLLTELTNIILDYAPEMIVARFRGSGQDRDHICDVICYKAMEMKRWEALVNGVIDRCEKEEDRIIQFVYDCDASMTEKDIIENTKIFNDTQLVTAMEHIYPRYLGSDIDVFDAIENGQREPYDFDNHDDYDDWSDKKDKEEEEKHMWAEDKEQSHIRVDDLIKMRKAKQGKQTAGKNKRKNKGKNKKAT